MIRVTRTAAVAAAAGSKHSVRHSSFQSAHVHSHSVSILCRSVGMGNDNNNEGRGGNKSAMHVWWRSLVCWHRWLHTTFMEFIFSSHNYDVPQSSHCGHVTHTHGGLAMDILNGRILPSSIRSSVDFMPTIKSMRCRCTNRSASAIVGWCRMQMRSKRLYPWIEQHTGAWMYFVGFITSNKI